jgi:hypothetical protein
MLAFVITASIIRPSTITKKSSPLKPLGQLRPNFGGMVLWQSTSKIVSDSPDLQPTWLLLPKIKKGGIKFKKSSSLKLLGQLELNFAQIVLG